MSDARRDEKKVVKERGKRNELARLKRRRRRRRSRISKEFRRN